MSLKLRVLEMILYENKFNKGASSEVADKLSMLFCNIRRKYFELLDKDEAKVHNV
jgi:hypothetical protein